MAKPLVTDSGAQTRVPFLRGILTRSLQDAGLPFEAAYELADKVREDLGDAETITTAELRDRVIKQLGEKYDGTTVKRYKTPARAPATIHVRDHDDQVVPFSRAQHQRCLESCSLTPEESSAVSQAMYQQLVTQRVPEITSKHLGHMTYKCLYEDKNLGPAVAKRYLVWVDFLHSGRPILLVIGGTAGTGKSTIATELATRLEIVRTQSTDMLREVMRLMIPERLMPALHKSSFNAWEALPPRGGVVTTDQDALLADGYRTQAELVSVALEAVVNRALRERVSLILEGVHVQPSFMQKVPTETDAVVVPVMLAVLKPEKLRKRIRGRGSDVPERRAERYLGQFDFVWRLQSYLLSEADRLSVPIIANDDKEKVIREIMRILIETVSKEFDRKPEEVFR